MMLDWNAIEDLPDSLVPDILIGADIVYDPSILKPLSNVIQTFVARNKDLEVYIASVIRNEETFNEFLKTLGEHGSYKLFNQIIPMLCKTAAVGVSSILFVISGEMYLDYENLEVSKSVFIDWDESINKCLLKIKAKLK